MHCRWLQAALAATGRRQVDAVLTGAYHGARDLSCASRDEADFPGQSLSGSALSIHLQPDHDAPAAQCSNALKNHTERSEKAIAACGSTLVCPLAFSEGSGISPKDPHGIIPKPGVAQKPEGAPQLSDIQFYEIFFRRVAFLEDRARKREEKGEDGTKLRSFVAFRLGLDQSENQIAHQVAFDCLEEIGRLDAQAKEIILQEREKFPGGRNTAISGRPAPPPILASLQTERDNAILRARETLKSAFGEFRFALFDSLMKDCLTETSRQALRR